MNVRDKEKPECGPQGQQRLLRQMWRFFLVGSAAFMVNGVLVEILVHPIGPVKAQLFAFPLAATVAWWLNRTYTFGASSSALHREWFTYIMANGIGWLINNGVYLLLIYRFRLVAQHPSLAVAAGSIAGMFVNFILSRQLVFRKNDVPPLPKTSSSLH
nr:GtrA family protein [uncultured Desulfobulbus sp.]